MASTWRYRFTFRFSISFISRVTSTTVCPVCICTGSIIGKTVIYSKDTLVNIYEKKLSNQDFWKILHNTSNGKAQDILGMYVVSVWNLPLLHLSLLLRSSEGQWMSVPLCSYGKQYSWLEVCAALKILWSWGCFVRGYCTNFRLLTAIMVATLAKPIVIFPHILSLFQTPTYSRWMSKMPHFGHCRHKGPSKNQKTLFQNDGRKSK